MSSITFWILGPILRQFGAENTGKQALVRSLLSLLMVRLELGGCGGRGVYSSYQGGGGGEEVEDGCRGARETCMITVIELSS